MKKTVLTVLALLASMVTVSAQDASADDANARLVRARAVEAVIWGMPAVNADLMLQEALKAGAKPNDIVFWSKPVNWKNQTLTPNPDAIYFMSFWNVKDGPVVIDIPPAEGGSFAGNIDDVWQMPLEDVGPAGADKGKGGKYIIVPPRYRGKTPAGAFVLHPDTWSGFALLRSNLPSHSDADIAKAAAYGKRARIYRLGAPATTNFIDVYDKMYDSTIRFDASFFSNLDRVVQSEPWLQRDRVMIDQLRMIGIEKGKAFNPDTKMQTVLDAAAKDAHAILSDWYDAGFPTMTPGSHWFPAARPDMVRAASAGYADVNEYPVDARGVTYTLGFVGIKRLGTAQFYLMSSKDKDGNAYEGSNTYRLKVPANPPVKQYWSLTVYDRETHALVKNLDRASRASNAAEVKKNPDGTVDLYVGPKAPAGQETNWIPTDPARKFEFLFRLYGPQPEFFEKKWVLPDVEKVAAQ
jgi:hypothetical protein